MILWEHSAVGPFCVKKRVAKVAGSSIFVLWFVLGGFCDMWGCGFLSERYLVLMQ